MAKIKNSFWYEFLFIFAIVLAADYFFFAGDRFWGINPHPFFFIVLLAGVQYGAAEGLITALVATIVLLFGNLPEQTFSQDIFKYYLNILNQPLIWMASAVVFGGYRDKFVRERGSLQEKLAHSEKQAKVFSTACQVLDFERKRLETHVSGQSSFMLTLHQAALNMGAVEPDQMLDNILEITRKVMKAEKCSWFTTHNSVLEADCDLGWEIEDPYSRVFIAFSPLFQEVVGRQRILSITDPEDEKILAGQGMLAGPLVNSTTGKVYGMLKIEKLNFLSLNFQSVQTFKVLCEWLSALFEPDSSLREETTVINPSVYKLSSSKDYIDRLSHFLTQLADKGRIKSQTIVLRPPESIYLDPDWEQNMRKVLNEALQNILGNRGLFFAGKKKNREYIVVLPNVSLEQAKTIFSQLMGVLRDRLGNTFISEFVVSIRSVGEESETESTITH